MTDPQEAPSNESQTGNSVRHGVSAGHGPENGTHLITDQDVAVLLAARNCLDRLVELGESLEAITATMNLHLGRRDGALVSAARSTREQVRDLLRRIAAAEQERNQP